MPEKKYYGSETEKAIQNFGRGNLPRELIRAYGEVKKSCIMAMQENGKVFGPSVYGCVLEAADEVVEGKLDSHFPLSLKQGGAGTSINMNINEVIAGRASELSYKKDKKKIHIDPIDDINRYQSTNDTFPTAVTVMLYRDLLETEESVIKLQESLIKKENETGSIMMTGRTEMQDALPITLGQVFASWAGGVERDRWRLHKLKERIRTTALGGTALGTCFSAPQEYIYFTEKYLRQITGLPLARSQNLTDEIANQDKWAELANGYSLCALNIFKMTGDLLLYTSSFIGEIRHPVLQYGSTIMAAKTNPVILELARGLSISVQHEAGKIASYAQNGQLQLNAYLPFILESFIEIHSCLNKAISALLEKFFPLMELDHERIEENMLRSHVLLNTLVPVLGYHKIKEIYEILNSRNPGTMEEYKKIIIENTSLKKEELDQYFDRAYAVNAMRK